MADKKLNKKPRRKLIITIDGVIENPAKFPVVALENILMGDVCIVEVDHFTGKSTVRLKRTDDK